MEENNKKKIKDSKINRLKERKKVTNKLDNGYDWKRRKRGMTNKLDKRDNKKQKNEERKGRRTEKTNKLNIRE